jgi:NADH dehydrogenase
MMKSSEGIGPGPGRRHRVVVVGGGFGGLFATRALRWSPVDVTLVDREPHHLFQPLLYQVATGILSQGEIAPLLRHVLRSQRNAEVVLAAVTGFDLDRRSVHIQRTDGAAREIPYDSLIVAAGAGQSYFGHDELAEHAPGMKTLDDALRLRGRLLQALEMAELSDDPKQRAGWMTVAIVGAGPTGVEIAGQVRALATRALGTSFRRIDPGQIRVLLLDAGHEPLAHFGERLSEAATKDLDRMGVELHMGVRVTSVDDESVVLERSGSAGSERVEARTVIWAAGVEASPLAKMLATGSGATCDRAGRIEVRPDCTLPGHPEVFAIGDMASLDKLPGVAEVAMQQGLYAAKTIRRRIAGDRPLAPFRYRDLGSMAMIGRFDAVVSFKGLRIHGLLGFLAWLFVHLTFLTGFANRFGALLHWGRTFLGRKRSQLAYSSRYRAAQ